MNMASNAATDIFARPPDIGWLAEAIRRNRFLPEPPSERIFVGDGDFRAVGAEFLQHLVTIAGLDPHARFLDIGSGIGRLAIPLTQYLAADASYEGVDPVAEGIEWCSANISPAYPHFSFCHFDVRHAIYNPGGAIDGRELTLPVADESRDFAAMISVVTHLPAEEVARYASETARVIAPGGTLMLTAFVMEKDGRANGMPAARLKFKRAGGVEWHAIETSPLSAVGFDDGFIETTFMDAGFTLRRRLLGNWRGGSPDNHFQDIFVFERRRAGK